MSFLAALCHILIRLGLLPDLKPLIHALDQLAEYDRRLHP